MAIYNTVVLRLNTDTKGTCPCARIKPGFFIEKNMSFLLEQTRIKLVSIERGPLYFYLIRW